MKTAFVIREHYASTDNSDNFVSLAEEFPEYGFTYFETLDRASLFATPDAAALAIRMRNEAMEDDQTTPFSIVPVKVETTPEHTVTEPLEVEAPHDLGTLRYVDGRFELKNAGGRWFPSAFFNTTQEVGVYSPADLRLMADLIESPTVTTTVPGSTTITLI